MSLHSFCILDIFHFEDKILDEMCHISAWDPGLKAAKPTTCDKFLPESWKYCHESSFDSHVYICILPDLQSTEKHAWIIWAAWTAQIYLTFVGALIVIALLQGNWWATKVRHCLGRGVTTRIYWSSGRLVDFYRWKQMYKSSKRPADRYPEIAQCIEWKGREEAAPSHFPGMASNPLTDHWG